MNQTKHKLLSGVLAAVLLLQTALPTAVYAAEPAAKTIVGFSALEQSDYTLTLGADEAAVEELLATFPESITAKVEYIVTEEVTQSPPPPVADSGKPETLPPEDTADDGSVEADPPLGDDLSQSEKEEPSTILDSDADKQEPSDKEQFPPDSDLPDTSLVEKVVSEEVELAVTWESDKPLTTEKAGTFTYTALLSDTDRGRYDFAHGVSLPELTVTVAEPMKRTLLGDAAINVRTTTLNLTGSVSYQKADGSTVTVDASANSITDTAEGWSWDKANNTLTLNGVNIKGEDSDSYTYGIVLPADSTIVLNGSNKVQAGISAIIPADNHWRVSSGVYGKGAITIEGDGALEATGGKATGEFAQSNGICAESNVIIKGVTVTATGGEADGSVGINTNSGAVEISGSTVLATGGKAPNGSMGIVTTGDVTISGASTVTATGGETNRNSVGINSDGLTISGASTVTATGGETNRNSVGINVNGNATISGASTVTATGRAGGGNTGINVNGDLTISGASTVIATAEEADGGSGGILVNAALTISGASTVTATGGAGGGSNGISAGGALTISGGTVTATAGESDGESIGIRADGTLNISGGTVTATAGESGGDISIGIIGLKPVKISGGKITAKGNTFAVGAVEGIILGAGPIKMGIVTPVGGKIGASELINGQVIVTASGVIAKEVVIEQMFPLTLSGTGTNASGTGMYSAGQTADINAGTMDGYTFKNWTSYNGITFADANSASTSFIMPASAVTVTANWTQNVTPPSDSGNGGGNNGGDGGNTTVTTPPATTEKPNLPTQGNITITPTISGDTASVSVPTATVKDAISKAQAEAKKNGKTDNSITVEIKADTKNATNLTANLPKASIDALVNANIKETKITSGVATISLGLDVLKEVQKRSGGDVTVIATKVANSTLSNEAKALVGNRPVYDLNITGKNGTKVTSFGKGTVSVSIPYPIGANEAPSNLIACYIDSTGKVQEMPNSAYDPETKTLGFVTNHFSLYGVGYKASAPAFSDITDHPAKDSIEFVAARGLLTGTGEGKFSPNSSMTSGMLLSALGKMTAVNVSSIGKQFAPEQAISREQMAVIMESYAKAIGFNLPRVHAQNTFADNAKISGNAKDAVKVMQMAGVLTGKSGNKFDPQGKATRAEVSAVLKRFVELAISTESSQGWMRNDSGKWMFFEGGRPVTGTKTISGVSCTFDKYGETADLSKNLTYGSYSVKVGDSWWQIANAYQCNVYELAEVNGKTVSSMIHPGDVLKIPQQ